ncbi:hypothetical protein [Thioalkalivibrio sp. ALgr3]|uniref:hypothetical protein n=1 Tax=Thioalkalivibrio sp. ALgr3 TaxID=1239292 RepID=UPI00036769C4|nr:hypothetical protein [Thioalkalivibrio sp. ALgr3]
MKKMMMTLALLVPMTLGLTGCMDDADGPEIDASNTDSLIQSTVVAATWLEEQGEPEKGRELDEGMVRFHEKGKAEKVDGMQATEAWEVVGETGRESIDRREQAREEERERTRQNREEADEAFKDFFQQED